MGSLSLIRYHGTRSIVLFYAGALSFPLFPLSMCTDAMKKCYHSASVEMCRLIYVMHNTRVYNIVMFLFEDFVTRNTTDNDFLSRKPPISKVLFSELSRFSNQIFAVLAASTKIRTPNFTHRSNKVFGGGSLPPAISLSTISGNPSLSFPLSHSRNQMLV